MSSFVQVAGRVSVYVVIDGMPFSASLANADGTTTCAEPVGRPFVKLELPGDLAPGGRATVVLDIVNPLHAKLPYRVVVCAGPGTP